MVTTISKQSFASDGNASNVGNTTVARYSPGQSNNSTTHGYQNGGFTASWTVNNVIDKFAFASDGTSTDVGDLVAGNGDTCGISY